jgi:hypothetical protein
MSVTQQYVRRATMHAQVRLSPGMHVDLSGKAGDLVYEVYRDEHAHA